MVLSALAGSLPGGLLYALTGVVAASFQNGATIFLLVLPVAGVSWFVGRWMGPCLIRPESRRT
jgi:membrane associated rhomboid family serine protease